jgi:hypothetical protein
MTTLELLRTAREFRNGLLGTGSSERMCLVVCAPLAGYLHFLGEAVEVVEGKTDGVQHCWIRLPDDTILDPTADQFSTTDQPMPEIYIGKQPRWYREKKTEVQS